MNRNKKWKYSYLLLLAGMIVFFGGCKTVRPTTSVALSEMKKEERIESIKNQEIPFKTLSSSLRFSIKPGLKKSAISTNAQLRIIRDQIIQLSLRIPILGTEVARVNITPDRIVIIDRSNQRYASESMQTIKEKSSFEFDFYSLQALFTNQLFIPGKSSLSRGDYRSFDWSEDNYLVRLNTKDNQGIFYNFVSDAGNRIIQTEMYKDKKGVNLNWLYQDFESASNNQLFPMKMTMELTVPKDRITLNLAFNKVDIDTDFEPDTTIPNRYQPIKIEQIIELIQSFK